MQQQEKLKIEIVHGEVIYDQAPQGLLTNNYLSWPIQAMKGQFELSGFETRLSHYASFDASASLADFIVVFPDGRFGRKDLLIDSALKKRYLIYDACSDTEQKQWLDNGVEVVVFELLRQNLLLLINTLSIPFNPFVDHVSGIAYLNTNGELMKTTPSQENQDTIPDNFSRVWAPTKGQDLWLDAQDFSGTEELLAFLQVIPTTVNLGIRNLDKVSIINQLSLLQRTIAVTGKNVEMVLDPNLVYYASKPNETSDTNQGILLTLSTKNFGVQMSFLMNAIQEDNTLEVKVWLTQSLKSFSNKDKVLKVLLLIEGFLELSRIEKLGLIKRLKFNRLKKKLMRQQL